MDGKLILSLATLALFLIALTADTLTTHAGRALGFSETRTLVYGQDAPLWRNILVHVLIGGAVIAFAHYVGPSYAFYILAPAAVPFAAAAVNNERRLARYRKEEWAQYQRAQNEAPRHHI